jgi:hypothetical protein
VNTSRAEHRDFRFVSRFPPQKKSKIETQLKSSQFLKTKTHKTAAATNTTYISKRMPSNEFKSLVKRLNEDYSAVDPNPRELNVRNEFHFQIFKTL